MGLRCCLATLRIPHFGGLFRPKSIFNISTVAERLFEV